MMSTKSVQVIAPEMPSEHLHVENDGAATVAKPDQMAFKQRVKNFIILTIALVLVIGLLLIPIVLYYSNKPTTEDDFPIIVDVINLQTCSINPGQIQPQTFLGNTLIDMCEADHVNGILNNCSTRSAVISALQVIYTIGVLSSDTRCIESFSCETIHAVCDSDTNLTSLSVQCVELRDNNCPVEWRVAENFFNISVPDCNNINGIDNTTTIITPPLNCPDNYGVFCGSFCLPLCDEMSPFSGTVTVFFRVWASIFHVFSMISSTLVIVASLLNYRKIFQHPMIFVVYGTISLQINSFSTVLPYITGSDNLQCSDDNYFVALQNPTDFCQFQGTGIHFGAITFFLFWLFHIAHLFFSLAFPFKAHHISKSFSLKLKIHIAEVTFILLCGFLPSIVIISTSKYEYVGFPLFCFSSSHLVFFYTYVLPIAIGAVIGVCLLFASFWIVRKRFMNNDSHNHKMLHRQFFSVAEIKLIILFLYYWVTLLLLLTSFGVVLHQLNDQRASFLNHVTCSAGGYREECEVFRENLKQSSKPLLIVTSILILFTSFCNVVNLIFVLQFSNVKKWLKKLF